MVATYKTRRATKNIAFCLLTALLCASCATGARKESDEKSPKELSQIYTELGTQALLRGEPPQAVEDLRKALAQDATNAVALNHLGLAYYQLGKKAEAKKAIQKAVEANPNYSDALINLGNFAGEEGNLSSAKSYYRRALDNLEYKLRHRALTNLAQLALRENNTDEARRLLYESIQVNPEYCLSHFLLGTVFMRDARLPAAAAEFKKSVASECTSNVEGHYQLGLVYMKAKEFTKARSQFVYLVEQHPQTLQAQKAGDLLREIP